MLETLDILSRLAYVATMGLLHLHIGYTIALKVQQEDPIMSNHNREQSISMTGRSSREDIEGEQQLLSSGMQA